MIQCHVKRREEDGEEEEGKSAMREMRFLFSSLPLLNLKETSIVYRRFHRIGQVAWSNKRQQNTNK